MVFTLFSLKKLLPIIMIITLISGGCMFKNGKYIHDNPIEEIGEAALDAKTGVSLDFTPSTPEK